MLKHWNISPCPNIWSSAFKEVFKLRVALIQSDIPVKRLRFIKNTRGICFEERPCEQQQE
jgi:hypothetical protein